MKSISIGVFVSMIGIVGCIPTLPAKENYPHLDKETSSLIGPTGTMQIKRCVDQLNRDRGTAAAQRNVGAGFAFAGGALGVASGTVSGVLDKEQATTKNALAFIAAGGALVALTAPLIGNPAVTLESRGKRVPHWNKAQDALHDLEDHAQAKPPEPGPLPESIGEEPSAPPAPPEGASDDRIAQWKREYAEWETAHKRWKKQQQDFINATQAWQKKQDALTKWRVATTSLTKRVFGSSKDCGSDDPPAVERLPTDPANDPD